MFLDIYHTVSHVISERCSNAREGIFCFWTYLTLTKSAEHGVVLMPARAFFVFGHVIVVRRMMRDVVF